MVDANERSSQSKNGSPSSDGGRARLSISNSQNTGPGRVPRDPESLVQNAAAPRPRHSTTPSSFVFQSKRHDRFHPYSRGGHSRPASTRRSFQARNSFRAPNKPTLPGQWPSLDSEITVTGLAPGGIVSFSSDIRQSLRSSLASSDVNGSRDLSEEDADEELHTVHNSPQESDSESDEELIAGDIVIRDAPSSGPFHPPWLTRQRPELPCTNATQANALHLKRVAHILKDLPDAQDIYMTLIERLERILETERELATHDPDITVSFSAQTSKLADFLKDIKDGRIATGERAACVEAELKWANWIDDAAKVGVLHLRHEDCQCKRYWKEEN